jgi:hypothetical protein
VEQQQHPSITSRATVGNAVSYSKEALDELRKSTQSTTPGSRLHDSHESSVEEKFPTLLGGTLGLPCRFVVYAEVHTIVIRIKLTRCVVFVLCGCRTHDYT